MAVLLALSARGYASDDGAITVAQPGTSQSAPRGGTEPVEGTRAPEEEPSPALLGISWRLAPFRWWGAVVTELRSYSAEGAPRRYQNIDSLQLNAASYIWQPWFAQVSGGVTALTSRDRGGETGSRSNAYTGNGKLDLFPASRFPFQSYVDVSDSRTSTQFTGQQYRNVRYGIRQSYKPLEAQWNATGSYDRSVLTSPNFGRDVVDVLNGNYLQGFEQQNVEASANWTRNARQSGESLQSMRLFGRHNYRYDETSLLTLETLGSYGSSDESLSFLGTTGTRRIDGLQLSSFATWRPDEDDPLYVTGGARFFTQADEAGTFGSNESRSLMAYGSANYRVNRNMLLNGGGSVQQTTVHSTSTETRSEITSNQFVGATYTPDVRRFGEFTYHSNFGATLANDTGARGSAQTASAQAGHGLQRSYSLSPEQSLGLGLNQSLGLTHNTRSGSLQTLAHSAHASWSIMKSSAMTGYVSGSIGDSRTFGESESAFQLVNLQASGQMQLSRFSSFTANLTLQGTRQESDRETTPASGWNVTTNGGVTYQNTRFLGIARLAYLATYNRSDYLLNSRQQGDLEAPREQATWSLDQRLEYRIGRIEASLQYRLAEFDGKKNALVFFRLARHFGD